MTGVLYSSSPLPPPPDRRLSCLRSSCLRWPFFSGISPSFVLSDAMEASEKRFRKLAARPRLVIGASSLRLGLGLGLGL